MEKLPRIELINNKTHTYEGSYSMGQGVTLQPSGVIAEPYAKMEYGEYEVVIIGDHLESTIIGAYGDGDVPIAISAITQEETKATYRVEITDKQEQFRVTISNAGFTPITISSMTIEEE